MNYDIYQGDVMKWAEEYDGPPFHAALMDPPYHLTEITKRFGAADASPAQYGTDGAFQRASKGFMGKTWDGGDIAFRPETWAALARHLHPGAYGMAFASTRGYHRMACAIEDAGLIIHTMLGWSFGSGFPKATRIDVQVDRAGGQPGAFRDFAGGDRTAPATDLAVAWQGHRYGGQAIKPAFEPIVVFQKPYQGRPVDSITRTGAGALNVDGGRIGTSESTARRPVSVAGAAPFGSGLMGGNGHAAGRWPANLLLAHDPACNGACVPGCAVRRLGEQSGVSEGIQGTRRGNTDFRGGERSDIERSAGFGDTGTAARYFFNADWMLDRLDAEDPVRYVAKASTAEREMGLDGWERTTVDDGRQTPIDNPYLRGETERRNTHPTVKPLDLCRYLATLLLPPDLYAPRRILVPFAGSGSEMIGAGIAGWEYCQGVELEESHVDIARTRLAWWVDVFGREAA